MRLFATCSQGLEPLLAEELRELGYPEVKEGFRGVYVDVENPSGIYQLNYCSRIAGRILLPLASFKCKDRQSLYKGCDEEVDWSLYLSRGKSFAIDANVNNNRELRNSLFAAQVMKDAICDQLRKKRGERPDVNPRHPDVQLNLFINQDQAIISFDTSGMPLFKRGYRLEAVEAPLQESLAAAILRIVNRQENEILCDPCCGSGTFLIEAALMASRTPPGYLRKDWGFQHLPEYEPQGWLKVKNEADKDRRELPKGLFLGIDINKNAVRIAKANLRAAGFHQVVEVIQADFRDYEPAVLPHVVVANPPYGIRMEEEEPLKPLYRALGDFLKRKMAKPGRGYIITGSLPLSKEIGLAPKKRHVMSNSGIESRLLEFEVW